MKYRDSDVAREVATRTRSFVDEEVLPVERQYSGDGVPRSAIEELREKARTHDVYGPQIPEAYGGLGLDFCDAIPAYEAASRSILGQMVVRVDAPDEGNMHLLEIVGTDEQRERWLEPLARGEMRSGFALTEPMPGAGDDAMRLKTSAEKEGDEWVINGHKSWVTQGCEADIVVIVARTDQDAHPYAGSSIFVVPSDVDGLTVERDIPHLGEELVGMSFAELTLEDVGVPEENVLGAVHEGFAAAQQQLGFTRLTHCMRYSGFADRALDVATAYLSEREAFGEPLADKQSPRFAIARERTRLHAARTMYRHAAAKLANDDGDKTEIAMCKVFTATVVQDAVDTAVQLCGASGIGKDLPLADLYESARHFRILDGSDEVHLRTVARTEFEEPDERELANLMRYDATE